MTIDDVIPTESIPLPRRIIPARVEAPLTERVSVVSAPTLTLIRNGAGWVSPDGVYAYPSTAHMFADWPEGVDEIPDPSPVEKARHYFEGDSLPRSVQFVTETDWDNARVILEEALKDVLAPPVAKN